MPNKLIGVLKNKMQHGLALIFIVPYWKPDEDSSLELLTLKREILKSKTSFSAWFHNKTGKNLIDDNGNIFDSVAIVADLA